MTILLVDDDEDDVSLFQDIIQHEIDNTIKVIVSKNGLLCLDVLLNVIPDVIFLDINMPIMNGKECFDLIKNNDSYKNIPIVILATSFDQEDVEYYKSHGAQYLPKSTRISHFIESLKIMLDICVFKVKKKQDS